MAFVGSAGYAPATAARSFTITRQSTTLALDPASASALPGEDPGMVARLTEATGKAMLQRTIVFVVSGSEGWYATAVGTYHLGEAGLGVVPLPPGNYSVHATFGDVVTLPNGTAVTLTDESYAGSTATGSLIITSNP
ncbi:MAG TPA: hypothetical protein VF177_15315 [Anaerolineae bacterium]